ncbi:MAG: HAMP domain-containing sensor histidine kinase, partial [Planctomycetota bacterium]
LTGMKGGSHLVDIAIKNQDTAMLERGWNIVKKSQNKISELVLDMLNFCRQTTLTFNLQEVNPLIEEIFVTIEANDWGKKISFKKELGNVPRFKFDTTGMHRCLLNLIYNAIDAIQDEGIVSVSTSFEENQIFLRVADTGCGIPPHLREKIFDILFTTKGSKGTGIGLAATKKIILEHGGRIEVESEVNKGSCFIMKFPLEPK